MVVRAISVIPEMAGRKRSMSNDIDMHVLYKELDGASCPICMDHPHNVVLLLCSSHDKGCRSYLCDTSCWHSSCLDCFKRLRAENRDTTHNMTQETCILLLRHPSSYKAKWVRPSISQVLLTTTDLYRY
ncbi:hypothetical protein FXO38_34357 [Capsicum annuum]|nr:hypothetical protein FXO38_34357 [Capsicum annuum]